MKRVSALTGVRLPTNAESSLPNHLPAIDEGQSHAEKAQPLHGLPNEVLHQRQPRGGERMGLPLSEGLSGVGLRPQALEDEIEWRCTLLKGGFASVDDDDRPRVSLSERQRFRHRPLVWRRLVFEDVLLVPPVTCGTRGRQLQGTLCFRLVGGPRCGHRGGCVGTVNVDDGYVRVGLRRLQQHQTPRAAEGRAPEACERSAPSRRARRVGRQSFGHGFGHDGWGATAVGCASVLAEAMGSVR